MGWSSSKDTANQVKLKFDSADDAIKYAEKNGWEYDVVHDQERIVTPRNYSDNFVYRPVDE
jgi:NADH dehydrogenase (ubiquinone) Fe-S protein 4